jgi:hypothetical protein
MRAIGAYFLQPFVSSLVLRVGSGFTVWGSGQ